MHAWIIGTDEGRVGAGAPVAVRRRESGAGFAVGRATRHARIGMRALFFLWYSKIASPGEHLASLGASRTAPRIARACVPRARPRKTRPLGSANINVHRPPPCARGWLLVSVRAHIFSYSALAHLVVGSSRLVVYALCVCVCVLLSLCVWRCCGVPRADDWRSSQFDPLLLLRLLHGQLMRHLHVMAQAVACVCA